MRSSARSRRCSVSLACITSPRSVDGSPCCMRYAVMLSASAGDVPPGVSGRSAVTASRLSRLPNPARPARSRSRRHRLIPRPLRARAAANPAAPTAITSDPPRGTSGSGAARSGARASVGTRDRRKRPDVRCARRRMAEHPAVARPGVRCARRRMAPQPGLEPGTLRLTAGCSTIELLRNKGRENRVWKNPQCNGSPRGGASTRTGTCDAGAGTGARPAAPPDRDSAAQRTSVSS